MGLSMRNGVGIVIVPTFCPQSLSSVQDWPEIPPFQACGVGSTILNLDITSLPYRTMNDILSSNT